MRKKYFVMTVLALVLLATVGGCKGKGSSEQVNTEVVADGEEGEATEENDADLPPVPAVSEEGVKEIVNFITDMYERGRYLDYDFLNQHCTEEMKQFLKNKYDYDGEGYAVWLFRTSSQDSKPGCEDQTDATRILSVKAEGDDWYTYKFLDGGWKGENRIKVFFEEGNFWIDGLKSVYDEAMEAYQ